MIFDLWALGAFCLGMAAGALAVIGIQKDKRGDVLANLTSEIHALKELTEKTIAEDNRQTAIMNKYIIAEGVKEAIEESI